MTQGDQLELARALLRREVRQLEAAVAVIESSLRAVEHERTELQLQLLDQGDRLHQHRSQLELLEVVDALIIDREGDAA